jgi:transposase
MSVDRDQREGPPQRKRHMVHGQQRVLEPYEPYLLGRWKEGCHTATVLWREIRTQGFAHSVTNVQRFVAQLRREGAPAPGQRSDSPLTKTQGPSARRVATLILRRPEQRSDEQLAYLHHLHAQDAALASAIDLAEAFLLMVRQRGGERLPGWLDAACRSEIGELERFATTLSNDLVAVQAGLTLRWSNGQTEGQVNRLKLVKRQAYGRAKVDLLRKRVLARS